MNTHGLVHDTVADSKVLYDSAVLRSAAGQESGSGSVYFEPGREYVFSVSRGSLKGFDQVTFHLDRIPDDMVRSRLIVECSSHTPSFETNDSFSIPTQTFPSDRLEFPIENSLITGMPLMWNDAQTLRLTAEIPLHISSVTAEKRSLPHGPRMTGKGLRQRLDPDFSGLETVNRLYAEDAISEAEKALGHYMRNRKKPAHDFTVSAVDQKAVSRADSLLEGYVLGQRVPEPVEWDLNPNGYLEWQHAFNRMIPFVPLLDAHTLTGDNRYARKVIRLVQTFIEQNPCPLYNSGGGSPAWETLSTACRCYVFWFRAFFSLLKSDLMPDELIVSMLKSFWMHAEHLYDFTGHSNNWLIVESRVLASCGILFPEFRESSKWREEGFRRLKQEFDRQVFDDGVQYEFSPGYHHMSMNGFFEAYRLSRLNGYTIPGISEEMLVKSFRYSMHTLRPDFSRLSINDSGPCNTSGENPVLRREGEILGDDAVVWAAACGRKGSMPDELSVHFPCAGLSFMRTGWKKRDLWSFFDNGPMGRAHIHRDCLSFEIYAYGTLFIADPGIVTYIRDEWTKYMRSTLSHSTVNIDGCDQRIDNAVKTEPAVSRTQWYSSDEVDIAGGVFADGYDGLEDRIVHTRFVVFIKPKCWIVFDEITGTGTHRAESVYQFTPMRVGIQGDEQVFRTMRVNLPNCEVFVRGGDPVLDIRCGETDPVRGWVAERRGEQTEHIPAPRCSALFESELPLRWATVIIPVENGPASGCSVEEICEGDSAGGVRCIFPEGETAEVLFAHTGERYMRIRLGQREWTVPVEIPRRTI